MFGVHFDAKALIALVVVLGCFGLLAAYAALNRMPEGYVIAIIASALSGVTGYYFGHANGTTTGLAAATTTLATEAIKQIATPQATANASVSN